MTTRRLAFTTLVAILLLVAPARAQQKKDASSPAPEMTTYSMVFLLRGDAWTPEQTAETEKLQEKHLGHFRAMHEAGKLVIAGPFLDGQAIRGICVYKVGSVEEARTLAEADPAVKAGG